MRLLKSLFYFLFLSTPLVAEVRYCNDPLFKVVADDPQLAMRTCRVASDARRELAACSVTIDRRITIKIGKDIEETLMHCLGLYRCGKDEIELLGPTAMSVARDNGGAFELISDQAYWDSILVHELTHAAYDTVPCPFQTCVATSEYVSYAMQVRSLPTDERALFGQTVELRGKPNHDAINAMILYMSPDRFAVYAWLHFQGRKDPCGYVSGIMNGDLYFDHEAP
jgi:hypothetical protein